MSVRVAKLARQHPRTPQLSSIDNQNLVLDTYIASRQGWELAPGCEYFDVSSATLQRPGLQRALDDAEQGRYGLLLVYRLDRLTRDSDDLMVILDRLERAGVALHSATEPIDTATFAGRALAQIVTGLTAYEDALRRKR